MVVFDVIVVDLNAPVTLAAGTCSASTFNYQFTSEVVGGSSETLLTGFITSILFTGRDHMRCVRPTALPSGHRLRRPGVCCRG
jgi:hypothetical protein